MDNNWNHKQLLVADFMQRSRSHSLAKSPALYLRPNFILGFITSALLAATVIFIFKPHQNASQVISTTNSLNDFIPSDFSFTDNLRVTSRYSNNYIRSSSVMYTFIYSKILEVKIPEQQAQEIAAAIIDAGQRTGLDPLLIAAITRAESAFNVKATSPVGAAGLMQLMPDTAKYIGKKVDLEPRHKADLYDVQRNLILGSAYFIYLNKMFHNNIQRSLVAYNWGPANAELAYYKHSRSIPTVTHLYTRRVISTHRSWKAEYAKRR